ncbi:aryl-sulfate sulfotransferase [candidate division KSB1 bacterium]
MRLVHVLALMLVVTFSEVSAAGLNPAEGDTLNYTHVLFRWDQTADAAQYNLQVAVNDSTGDVDPFEAHLMVDVLDSTLVYIETDSLDWGNPYIWKVRPIAADGDTGKWGAAHKFYTYALPDTIPEPQVTWYDESKYSPGVNFYDIFHWGYISALDKDGNVIWFHAIDTDLYVGLKKMRLYPNGNLTCSSGGGGTTPGVWEITLDGDVVWTDPKTVGFDMGGIHRMANGNYLGWGETSKVIKPIPEGPWKESFDETGQDSLLWIADALVEYDQDGILVWSWDPFEHYSTADFDSVTFAGAFARQENDWTHTNSMSYDPDEDMIYICPRNLDRITKIDHVTGEVVWNMGRDMPSGEVTFGHDLKFSRQHSIEKLPNGNLFLFDNGPNNTPKVSRCLEIEVTEGVDDTTATIVWSYTLPDSLYSSSNSDCDRLPNGNTLIFCRDERVSPRYGHMVEIDSAKNWVWDCLTGPRRIFDGERYPGLHPQAFSVIQPDFVKGLAEPTIVVPQGQTTITYTIHNEGWVDETYSYSLMDTYDWFSGSGTVDVAAGESAEISFTGTVYDETYPSILSLTVTPGQAPAKVDTFDVQAFSGATSVEDEEIGLPRKFALLQNYPNPFNPETNISFQLPKEANVNLRIYNISGQLVRHLVDDRRQAGRYNVIWRGDDERGRSVPSGVYFYEIRAADYVARKRMVLLK